jgi:hypothetical protein
VAAEARGYLQRLDDPARSACFPATHALTTGAEGGRVEAVVFAAVPNDPALELDLYLGQLVRVSGTESIASAACAATHRLLGVEAVEIIEVPPGAAAY